MQFVTTYKPQINWSLKTFKLGRFKEVHKLPNTVPEETKEITLCNVEDFTFEDDFIIIGISTEKEETKLPLCLNAFASSFDDNLSGDSKITVKQVIETNNENPICKQAYKMSQLELTELKRQLKEYLKNGVIEPSESPWSSPILFAKKKDGSFRMCVDYRALNKITKRIAYPPPRMDEVIEQTIGDKIFSKIDLKSGYH